MVTKRFAMTSSTTDNASVSPVTAIHYRYQQAGDVNVFYREAGDPASPVLLLLHGFAGSSFMFRDLIPQLADRYHVIAPDLPAFGFTEAPARGEYAYTFAQLAETIGRFTEALHLNRYALLVHDYGAPVGWRLALAHPQRVTALISQNGNAYEEGLGEAWAPIQQYWRDPTVENRHALSEFPTPAAIKWQYLEGVSDQSLISPDGYSLEGMQVLRPGNAEIQLDLLLDYASNVEMYPQFQHYFRQYQPPLLAVWGKNDPFFMPAGAEAWKRDLPDAEIRFYDTGHFALETHAKEIGTAVRDFLDRHVRQSE